MTQKEKDYEKVKSKAHSTFARMERETDKQMTIADALDFGFRQGYDCGAYQQMRMMEVDKNNHVRVLIAFGDEYAIASEKAIVKTFEEWWKKAEERGLNDWKGAHEDYEAAYRKGWEESDTFDLAWIESHPDEILQRLLDSHPEVLEKECKARIEDMRKEAKENADAFAFANPMTNKFMRLKAANAAMQGFISSGMMPDKMDGNDNYQSLAEISVRIGDALLSELEKTSTL